MIDKLWISTAGPDGHQWVWCQTALSNTRSLEGILILAMQKRPMADGAEQA